MLQDPKFCEQFESAFCCGYRSQNGELKVPVFQDRKAIALRGC